MGRAAAMSTARNVFRGRAADGGGFLTKLTEAGTMGTGSQMGRGMRSDACLSVGEHGNCETRGIRERGRPSGRFDGRAGRTGDVARSDAPQFAPHRALLRCGVRPRASHPRPRPAQRGRRCAPPPARHIAQRVRPDLAHSQRGRTRPFSRISCFVALFSVGSVRESSSLFPFALFATAPRQGRHGRRPAPPWDKAFSPPLRRTVLHRARPQRNWLRAAAKCIPFAAGIR